jgi:hypothetical protein
MKDVQSLQPRLPHELIHDEVALANRRLNEVPSNPLMAKLFCPTLRLTGSGSTMIVRAWGTGA